MNRVYAVEHHIDYEGFSVIGIFDNRKAAMELKDRLREGESYGSDYVVTGYSFCSTVEQHDKHEAKRSLARQLNWLRRIKNEDNSYRPQRVLEMLEEYKDLL